MKKKLLCLVLMALMLLGSCLTVSAEDYRGSTKWNVSFDGRNMNSNFKSADVTQDMLSILPGDSITLRVNLQNADDRKGDWYMSNEVLQSLEDGSKAEDGVYTYRLSYVDPAGTETVLFGSEMIGGEGGVDLQQATGSLADHFYLDRLEAGETAYIELYVKLDGETQGNAYQDTLAKIRMNFAVEKVYDDVVNTTITRTKLVTLNNVAKTGDQSPVVLLSVLALVSGIILLVVALILMKKRKNDEKGEGER